MYSETLITSRYSILKNLGKTVVFSVLHPMAPLDYWPTEDITSLCDFYIMTLVWAFPPLEIQLAASARHTPPAAASKRHATPPVPPQQATASQSTP